MIRLKKDGQYFDIDLKGSFTVEWTSVLFNDEADLIGPKTYAVLAPFTPRNNKLLRNAHLIQNRSARLSNTTAMLEIFGEDWKPVKLSFDVTPKGYELTCLFDNAEFAKVIKERKLPEFFINYNEGQFVSFMTDPLGNSRQETIDIMLDRAAHPGKGSCVFHAQKNDRIFGELDGDGATQLYDENYQLNYYNSSAAFAAGLNNTGNKRKWFYSPSFYLLWVVKQVCRRLGFEPVGEFFDDPRLATWVIDNTGFVGIDEIFALTGSRVEPAKHLPNITLAEFIKILRSTFKLALYFDGNERRAIFNYAPKLIDQVEATDITGYVDAMPTINRYTPTGVTMKQAIDDDDDMFKNFQYVKSFVIGDQSDPQKLEKYVGTLFMTDLVEVRPDTSAKWRIPRKRQVGNGYTANAAGTESYNASGYAYNDFAFRVLNYVGPVNDSQGNMYYYATSDGRDRTGTLIPGVLSCWMGEDNGIIATFIKHWLVYWLRTESVELTAHLPPELLLDLSPLGKICWTTADRTRMPALLDQVQFEQSTRQPRRIYANIKCYPVHNQAAADVKAFTEVEIGDIENAGQIYVKFTFDEYRVDRIYIFNQEIIKAIYWHAYLEFYSDPACTKPRNVNNLVVTMHYSYRGKNSRNYQDYNFYVKASGTKYQIQVNEEVGIDQVHRYEDKNDYWDKSYYLVPGPDYTIVK